MAAATAKIIAFGNFFLGGGGKTGGTLDVFGVGGGAAVIGLCGTACGVVTTGIVYVFEEFWSLFIFKWYHIKETSAISFNELK